MPDQDNTRTPLRKLGPSRKVRPQARGRRGPNPVVRSGRWLVGHPWAILGAAAAIWFAIWVVNSRTEPNTVKAAFPSAFNLKAGQDVSIDGRDAGKIDKVELVDGRSVVTLGIADDYWPLPVGTTATSRYGTTIGSGTRRVDLQLGPLNGKKIAEGGVIGTKDTRAAVDVDAVLNTLNGETRSSVTDLTRKMERALSGSEQDTNESLAATPEGLKQIDGFLKDLGGDSVALSGLITNADRLTKVLANRQQRVQDLVSVSARTFEAFASRTRETQATLNAVSPAMKETRTTLARVDGSLGGLQQLVDDIRPGAQRIRPLAKAALPALQNLSDIVPSALSTVRTTTRVAPELNTLLTNGTPFLNKVGRVTKEAEPMLNCFRPFAPDLVATLTNLAGWHQAYTLSDPAAGAAYAKQLDSPFPYQGRMENGKFRTHAVRARVTAGTLSLGSNPLTPKDYIAVSGNKYAYPRPAGLTTGNPIWQPQCGITKETSMDPAKDEDSGERLTEASK